MARGETHLTTGEANDPREQRSREAIVAYYNIKIGEVADNLSTKIAEAENGAESQEWFSALFNEESDLVKEYTKNGYDYAVAYRAIENSDGWKKLQTAIDAKKTEERYKYLKPRLGVNFDSVKGKKRLQAIGFYIEVSWEEPRPPRDPSEREDPRRPRRPYRSEH